MAFDGITIAAMLHELQNEIQGSRINKISQPEADELLFTLKTPNGQKRLYMSASASLPLIYLTAQNKPAPMTAPNFCMLLRKHIGNGRITAITQPCMERILRFEIEHLDELGDLRKKVLILELMGKHSNIIFCDENETIIDSIKHVSAQMSSVREVLPARTYFVPDAQKKLSPLSATKEAFTSMLLSKPFPLAKAIYESFTGVSPVAAEELCYISGIDSLISFSELGSDMILHLYNQFVLFFERVKNADFQPSIYYKDSAPRDFSVIPITHFDDSQKQTFSDISSLLYSFYSEKNTFTRIRQKSTDLRKIVQTALERARKKYALQLKQIDDTKNRDKYRIYGELLNTYGYSLEEGSSQLEALNYYSNEMVTIPLDKTKSTKENAQRYFDKYNKQKRTFETLGTLINDTKDDILYLESIVNALDIAQNEDDLSQIKEELTSVGFMKKKFSKQKKKISTKPLHYLSNEDYHIYVGKNNLQNDYLTFTFADGNDWWFHAKGVPGSHVIVKSNAEVLPDSVFEDAGRLAAYYSKSQGNEKAEIDYIQKKHIKKPKNGKPGFVVYHTNYSLIVDSDISNIKQLSD